MEIRVVCSYRFIEAHFKAPSSARMEITIFRVNISVFIKRMFSFYSRHGTRNEEDGNFKGDQMICA